MSLVDDLYEHYRDLVERGEIAPEDVPGPDKMAYEWCVGEWTAQKTRARLMRDGLAIRISKAKPLGDITDEVMIKRFWPKVDAPDENGCTKWNAADDGEYGKFALNGRDVKAHVVAYTYLIGPVPEDSQLDHVYELGCRSKLCVNIEHLEPVSAVENALRAFAAQSAAPVEGLRGAVAGS